MAAECNIAAYEERLRALSDLVSHERQNKADAWHREALLQDQVKALKLQVMEMEIALHTIATPKRPDGTYNMCREACEQIAKEALTCLQRTSKSH
jgi:hypothetical protein